MKKIACLFLVCFVLFSCKDNDSIAELSVGETNQITVIIEDSLWNGEVGDSIRKKLTTSVDGLPQEEPLFSLRQHTDRSGDDHFCKNRNIIIVEKSIEEFFEVRNDDFALHQSVIYIAGRNIPELLNLIEQQSDSIIKVITDFEITETQKKISLSPLDTQPIEDKFEISIDIPSDFEYIITEEKFIWLKKETLNGNSNILIYQIPYREPENQVENIREIITVRDSIGQKHIHSQEDNAQAYMITEEAYAPYFETTKLAQRTAFQTKGTWEIKGVFMSGPFLNYTIPDKQNNRILVLEGFAYAPSSSKRNMMHKLEAIIKSISLE